MNKRELDLLEEACGAEIEYALGNRAFGFIQSKSKLAERLANEGYLDRVVLKLPGRFAVVVRGFALSLAGNIAYCTSERCNSAEL